MRTPISVALVAMLAFVRPAAPDLLIVNARVFTGDASQPWTDAVAIAGDRIAAVGTTGALRATAEASTRVIDAGGRLLIPGINDAHTHIGATPPATPLEGPPAIEHDPTLAEVLTRLRAAVVKAPPGGWIIGEIGGAVIADPRATRVTLDRLSGDHPVLLRAWTGHGSIANTAALLALGIKDDEPNPPGGTFARAADGRRLTGLAHEYADYAIGRRLAALPDRAHQIAAFTTYAKDAAAMGITTAQVMMTAYPAGTAAAFLDGVDLPIRLRLIDFPITAMSAWTAPPVPARRSSSSSSLLTVSGTKWILDGTPIERLMFLREPYADVPSWRGRLNFSEADLRGFLQRALAANVQPMLHAVGDAAIAAVLDALEATGGERWKPLRPRIEHGDMLQSADFARAARMGVTIVQNPSHFTIPQIVQARVGAERAQRMFQVRAIVAAGVPFALGSDGPMNPFLNIMFATMNAANATQALTVEQALRAYTAGSAAAELADRDKGMLRAGLLADMALLSQDIFKIRPSDLPTTTSVLTIVNGRIVQSRLESAAPRP